MIQWRPINRKISDKKKTNGPVSIGCLHFPLQRITFLPSGSKKSGMKDVAQYAREIQKSTASSSAAFMGVSAKSAKASRAIAP
jgi:hypothetical protein